MSNSEQHNKNQANQQLNKNLYVFQNQKQILFKFNVVKNQIVSFNPFICKKILNQLIQENLRQKIKKNINKHKLANSVQKKLNNNQKKDQKNQKEHQKYQKKDQEDQQSISLSKMLKANKKQQPLIIIDQSQSQTYKNNSEVNINEKKIQYKNNANQVNNQQLRKEYKLKQQKNEQVQKKNEQVQKKNEQVQKLLEMINVIKSTAKRMKNQQQIQKLLIQAQKIGNMIKIIKQQQINQNQLLFKPKYNTQSSNSSKNQSNQDYNNLETQDLYWFSDNVFQLQKYRQNKTQFGYLKWSSEQDLLIQKINAHFEDEKIKKQLLCLLKYKTKQIIVQRFIFLKIDIDYQLKKLLLE